MYNCDLLKRTKKKLQFKLSHLTGDIPFFFVKSKILLKNKNREKIKYLYLYWFLVDTTTEHKKKRIENKVK